MDCTPAKCENGKCRATGECIEANRPSILRDLLDGITETNLHPEFVVSPPLVPALPSGTGHALSFVIEATHLAIDPPRTIVAFTGLAGAGKSTAAAHLVNHHGYQRVRFAGPLKAMMAALGLTSEQIDGSLKETPCDLLGGKTPRWAMQSLGTEWGRDLIAPDLWIRAWQHAVSQVPAGVPIVVDDVRFPNEAEAVRTNGGVIVRIDRPGAGTASVHSSEAHQLEAVETLRNIADERYLQDQVDILVTDLSWRSTDAAASSTNA